LAQLDDIRRSLLSALLGAGCALILFHHLEVLMRSLLSSKFYVFGALSLLASAFIPGCQFLPLGTDGGNEDPIEINPPTTQEVAEAKSLVLLAMDASQNVHAALDLLGLQPVYECGESRASFVGGLVPQLQAQFGCAQVSTSSQLSSDTVTISFSQAGCDIGAYTLSGDLVFTYSGGTDRFDMVLDAQGLQVDGAAIQVTGGYSTCGDQESYSITAQGSLPGQAGATYNINASVTIQEGFPIFGSPTLIFDGTGLLTTSEGTHQLSLDSVEYKPGDIVPQSGVLTFVSSSDHTIEAEFITTSALTQVINFSIDGRDLVSIPLITL
jgi:hypothetical protein